MKNTKFLSTLEQIGLSENEAKVYLAALSLGPTTILKIARAAGLQRTNTYNVVDVLKQKGLMSVTVPGLKKLYQAEHPDKLESILESRKVELLRDKPELLALYNLHGNEGALKYYEGLEAVKSIYDKILDPMKPSDYYLVISDMETFFNKDRVYFEAFLKKRIEKKMKTRLLGTRSKESEHMKKYAQNMNHEFKMLPDQTKVSIDTMITPYAVTFFDLRDPVSAISIENKSIIQMQKELFDIIWNS